MRVNRFHIIFGLLLGFVSMYPVAYAQIDGIYQKANEAYAKGMYNEALNLYDSLVAMQTLPPADLYYNLGNTYYKLGDIPHAILNYERALKLTPENDDIRFNLALANTKTIDRIEPVPQLFFVRWYIQLLTHTTAHTWFIAGAVFVWLIVLVLCLQLFVFKKPMYKKIAHIKIISFAMLAILFLILGILSNKYEQSHRYAIVMSSSSYVKHAPSEGGNDAFILHAGTKVEIEDEVDGWQKIRLADGNTGWIEKSALELI